MMLTKRTKSDNLFMYMLVETKPVVSDPRELLTIIRSSLKSLFGETEAHGHFVEVLEATRPYAIVKCPASSVAATRAALTFLHRLLICNRHIIDSMCLPFIKIWMCCRGRPVSILVKHGYSAK